MISLMKSRFDDYSDRVLAISHCHAYDKAVATQAELMEAINFKGSYITTMTGLCTTYASRGGVIFAC
jgi:hypothetical protein